MQTETGVVPNTVTFKSWLVCILRFLGYCDSRKSINTFNLSQNRITTDTIHSHKIELHYIQKPEDDHNTG